ncbi:MAG: PA2779 family protein [Pseudomonadota bacterium]|nr:PA2779 family protein [Pseudomonadota bacterium]
MSRSNTLPANLKRRILARLMAALMVVVSLMSASAQAAMVTTGELATHTTQQQTQAQVLALLSQAEARDTLLNLGVDPADVEQRVQAMTPAELQAFSAQVEDMQAGGSAVGVIVLVFVILIVLDLLGTTNIFPAIKPINTN